MLCVSNLKKHVYFSLGGKQCIVLSNCTFLQILEQCPRALSSIQSIAASSKYRLFINQFKFFFSDREWIERTIAQNDKDGDGGISLDEFIEMNKVKLNKQKSDHERKTQSNIVHEKARLAFNAYDRNRDGYLTKAEMKKTSKMMTEAQIDAVFDKYDKNKDGKLSFEEFKDLMESHNKEKRSQPKQQEPSQHQPSPASTTTSEVTITNE